MSFQIGDVVYHLKLKRRGVVLPRNAAGGMFVGAHETVVRLNNQDGVTILPTHELEHLIQETA